ncbi:hypothetical protein Trydic_g329 [Trypoxylus dichotomus]
MERPLAGAPIYVWSSGTAWDISAFFLLTDVDLFKMANKKDPFYLRNVAERCVLYGFLYIGIIKGVSDLE